MIKSIIKALIPEKARIQLRESTYPIRGLFYRGDNYTCNVCQLSFEKFLPAGIEHPRDNVKCPNCNSYERHRLLWLYLQKELKIESQEWEVIHFAPEVCLVKLLKKVKSLNYTTADRFSSLGELKVDLTDTQLPSDQYDLIICSHVLAHIEYEQKALDELYRILKPGGQLILLTYIDWSAKESYPIDRGLNEQERVAFYNQDMPLRVHASNFDNHLKIIGFSVETRFYANEHPELIQKLALPIEEALFICEK